MELGNGDPLEEGFSGDGAEGRGGVSAAHSEGNGIGPQHKALGVFKECSDIADGDGQCFVCLCEAVVSDWQNAGMAIVTLEESTASRECGTKACRGVTQTVIYVPRGKTAGHRARIGDKIMGNGGTWRNINGDCISLVHLQAGPVSVSVAVVIGRSNIHGGRGLGGYRQGDDKKGKGVAYRFCHSHIWNPVKERPA